MERNSRKPRQSISLSINRRSADALLNQEPTSPSTFLFSNTVESTPPQKIFSLDESIEFSPTSFNSSFSPSTFQSQSFENSEVCWKWAQKLNKNEHILKSDSILSESRFTTERTRSQQLPKRQKLSRNMRKAENTRTDEMLKRRCAKFRVKLLDTENLTPEKCLKPLKKQKELATKSTTIAYQNNITKSLNSFDDFLNDSDTDGFLIEATEHVEYEIIRLTQESKSPAKNGTTSESVQKNGEKRSSIYKKFFEDDVSDDVFGSLDDIIDNALKDTKPKGSFQRFNSLPVESNSPKSNHPKISKKDAKMSRNEQFSSKIVSPNFKRHASCHDVPIYYPHKQARRS